MCMNEKKGKKLNKDKGGQEITLLCVVQIIGYLIATVRNLLSTIILNFS